MTLPSSWLRLALLSATAVSASTLQPALFHGTSVVIIPSNETSSPPVNNTTTVRAANFFCYMAEEGYFSFGCNTSHCVPDSDRFHWYEYASRQSCNPGQGTCTYSTQNVGLRRPHHAPPVRFPETKMQYTIKPVDIGNQGFGQMAVSWVDACGASRVYGVGTRQVLSVEEGTRADCNKAMRTLRWVYDAYRPVLAMEVDWDVCEGADWRLVEQPGGGRYSGVGDL